jgi:hypothetical protein
MSESESGTSKTNRTVATFEGARVEMEEIGMDFIIGLPRS